MRWGRNVLTTVSFLLRFLVKLWVTISNLGAPLSSGVFCKGKIYCPWHGACFSGTTGNV